MSTSNPFEKLHVRHDKEDDEQGEFEQVKAKDKNVPFGIEQKKKKVRPKEKVEDEGNEGFEEVKNRTTKKRPQNDEYEEVKGKDHSKRRGINFNTNEERQYRESKRQGRGRKFDRQSGTGRGKEIAKGGAGGKFTWEGDDNNDDYYFEEALNPENKERKQRQPRRPKKEDKQEEGEDNKENEGETKEEGKKVEKEEKRERKKPELKDEEKLKIPEGAISLDEYFKKSEKPKEEEKKEIKRIQGGEPLTKVKEKKVDEFGTSQPGKKKGKKKKEKEVNQQEIDLNAQIGAELQIGETFDRRPRRGGRGQGGRGKGRGGRGRDQDKEGKEGGFVYNEEDFPKLE